MKRPRIESPRAVPGWLIVLFLGISVAMVYGRAITHDFINYDDRDYVVENAHVIGGLSLDGLKWAFTTSHAANWHPLTWLSHMLDCELFGLRPGGHHATSVALHGIDAVLLFRVLARMTAAPWQSALVAALFAVHPLHVESVTWVAERKDVLSTFFWILTLGAYARWVKRGGAALYALALAAFAFGLMAKPMLVTLPFLLLLLDYWPLRRTGRNLVQRIVEKLPFFILTVTSSALTFSVQSSWGAVPSIGDIPVRARLANAAVAYVAYLRELVWPSNLAVFYPIPAARPVWHFAASAIVLVASSVAVVRGMRRHPYLFTGWAWYLGTLVPVIGLVQVGEQARADRYTYVPLIGAFIIVAWGGAELRQKYNISAVPTAVVAGGLVVAAMIATWFQVEHWKNSVTLFEHALVATHDNYFAHASLAAALAQSGRADEAIVHCRESLRIKPGYSLAEATLGFALAGKGRIEESIAHYEEALKLKPDLTEVLNNLAWLRATSRNPEIRDGARAVELAQRACRVAGYDNPNLLDTLAAAYAEAGRFDEAVRTCERAVALAVASGQESLAKTTEAHLKLYLAGQAYHDQ
jgi:tetratricopeptide (TPR) repeat protein